MTPLAIIVNVILILTSIILIIAVLMQEGQRQGLGAIGGGAETFFGKNKAKSYEGRMALITKIAAAVFIVLAIAATIITTQSAKLPASTSDDEIVSAADEDADDVADVADEDDAADADDAAETTAEPTAEPADESESEGEVPAED